MNEKQGVIFYHFCLLYSKNTYFLSHMKPDAESGWDCLQIKIPGQDIASWLIIFAACPSQRYSFLCFCQCCASEPY